jgi:hypothetical protein
LLDRIAMPTAGSLSLYFAAAAVLVASAASAVACSSSPAGSPAGDDDESGASDGEKDAGFTRDGSTYDSSPSPDSGLGELRFQPSVSYSGYDGAHTFQVPVAVYDGASDLSVTADDPSSVAIAPAALKNPVNQDGVTDNGKYFLVTVKKAGTLTLTATSGGETATTTIHVAAYDAARWQAGETRYTNGSASDPPCTDCHVNGQAIDHSPAALATADDEKVATTITTGISPFGFPIQGVEGGHKWTVTEDEKDGLVTYLRALTPRGFQ